LLVNDLRHRGLSRKTILNALSALASLLRVARDWNYMAAELDWQKLRLPVEELQKPQRYFTPDESQRIIDAAPEPWNICFAFMAYLGLRTGEAVGVAWEHMDLDAGVLRIRQSNWRGKLLTVKSKSSVRDLPLPQVLVEMLKDYRISLVLGDHVRVTLEYPQPRPCRNAWNPPRAIPNRSRIGCRMSRRT